MELSEFLLQTRAEVKDAIADRLSTPGSAYLYEESIFTTLALMGFESPPEEEKRPNAKPRQARPGEKAA